MPCVSVPLQGCLEKVQRDTRPAPAPPSGSARLLQGEPGWGCRSSGAHLAPLPPGLGLLKRGAERRFILQIGSLSSEDRLRTPEPPPPTPGTPRPASGSGSESPAAQPVGTGPRRWLNGQRRAESWSVIRTTPPTSPSCEVFPSKSKGSRGMWALGPGLHSVRDHTETVFWSWSHGRALSRLCGTGLGHRASAYVSAPLGARDVFGTRHPHRGGGHSRPPLLGSRGPVERGPWPFPIVSSEDPALRQTAVKCSHQTHVPANVPMAWVQIRPCPMLIG